MAHGDFYIKLWGYPDTSRHGAAFFDWVFTDGDFLIPSDPSGCNYETTGSADGYVTLKWQFKPPFYIWPGYTWYLWNTVTDEYLHHYMDYQSDPMACWFERVTTTIGGSWTFGGVDDFGCAYPPGTIGCTFAPDGSNDGRYNNPEPDAEPWPLFQSSWWESTRNVMFPVDEPVEIRWYFSNASSAYPPNIEAWITRWETLTSYCFFYCGGDLDGEENEAYFESQILSEGPCDGLHKDPVLPVTEFMWAGRGCSVPESLELSVNSAKDGRMGMLIDDQYPEAYHMETRLEETAPTTMCDPVGNLAVQGKDWVDEESIFALRGVDKLGWGGGTLEHAGMEFTFSVDYAYYNLVTNDDQWKLVGPKAIINYGPEGDLWTYWDIGPSTYPDGWDYQPEPHELNTDEGDSVSINMGLWSQFDMQPGERATGQVLHTITTGDPLIGIPAERVGLNHLAFIRAVENGANYTLYLDLYKFNFTTLALDLQSSENLGNTEERPCATVSLSNCRIIFIEEYGTDGKLYFGDALYTGAKTNQGRICIWDWNQTTETLTRGTDYSPATRDGHQGSCLGYDKTYGRLWYGVVDDELDTMDLTTEGAGSGSWAAGARGDQCGLGFQMSQYQGEACLWHSVDLKWRVYDITSTTLSSTGLAGAAQTTDYPFGMHRRSWWYDPAHTTYHTSHYNTSATGVGWRSCYPSSQTYGWGLGTGMAYGYASSHLYQAQNRSYSRGASSATSAQDDTNTYGTTSGFTLSPDSIPGTYRQSGYFNHSFVMYNGTDKEYLVTIFQNASFTEWKAWLTDITVSDQDHIEIGEWWFESWHDISEAAAITNSTFGASYGYGSYGCYLKVVFKMDNDALYYVGNSTTDLMDGYATRELALAAAETIDNVTDAQMIDLDIGPSGLLTVYWYLKKELYLLDPTRKPEAHYMNLEMTSAPYPEPILEMHVGEDNNIKELYKTQTGRLEVRTVLPPNAGFIDMITSGSHIRRLLS